MLHGCPPARAVLPLGQGAHLDSGANSAPFPAPAGLSPSAVTCSQKPKLPGSPTPTQEASRLSGLLNSLTRSSPRPPLSSPPCSSCSLRLHAAATVIFLMCRPDGPPPRCKLRSVALHSYGMPPHLNLRAASPGRPHPCLLETLPSFHPH